MNQIGLSKWLKLIIVGCALCGAIVYLYIFPIWGKSLVTNNPEYSNYYWPWILFLWVTAIPCYLVLINGWQIATEIGKDNSFSEKNAALLKSISILAATDVVYFFAGNIIFLLLNKNRFEIVLVALFVVFAGITITIVSAALSHLVLKAAKLREENELTI